MTKEEIGKILKNLRISCGMTQKDIASKIGRTQQIVGHWETGYAQPDANTLFKLCEAYGTTVDEAFGFIKSKKAITPEESEHLKKYRSLDSRGKETVDLIIQREMERVNEVKQLKEQIFALESNNIEEPPADHLLLIAAHNETEGEEELRKMENDIKLLKKLSGNKMG